MWMRPFLFSLTSGCLAEHMGKKKHKICVLLRRCHLLNFEFDFMDRAPLLQDCPELHHCLFYQNGSSVNRDFAFIQHCQRNYFIQPIFIIHLDQYTNTNMYIYTRLYISIHTHMFVEFGKSIRNSDQTF